MCGLFGIIGSLETRLSEEDWNDFLELARVNNHRGPKGIGVTIISLDLEDTPTFHFKFDGERAIEEMEKMLGNRFSKIPITAVLGHCRAPTNVASDRLQPLVYSSEDVKSIFAHNGMMLDVAKMQELTSMPTERWDSVLMHHLLVQEFDREDSSTRLLDILTHLGKALDEGASFTFWWLYFDRLFLGRCQGTLYIHMENDEILTFSSEKIPNSELQKDGTLITRSLVNGATSKEKFEAYNPFALS